MCDDVFDEEDESCLPETNEWQRLKQARTADGYRDGLEKGEGDQLQSGFNAGYGSAVKTAFRAAHLRGAVSALLGINSTRPQPLYTNSTEEELQDLLQRILSVEKDIAFNNERQHSGVKSEVETTRGDCTKDSDESDSCGGGTCSSGDTNCQSKDFSVSPPAPSDDSTSLLDRELVGLEGQYQGILRGIGLENS